MAKNIRIAATSTRIDAAEAPAAIWALMRFRQHCGTAAPPRVMLLFWLLFGTARANDITSTCAAAFRLTLKGYVSNGKDPAKVCSPPPTTCRRPGGIYHMYCKQCAGYVMGKNVFNPLWPTAVHKPTFSALRLVEATGSLLNLRTGQRVTSPGSRALPSRIPRPHASWRAPEARVGLPSRCCATRSIGWLHITSRRK